MTKKAPKKTVKKKIVKKKASKKKAAKKKTVKKLGPAPKQITINIRNGEVSAPHAHAFRSVDKLRWHSLDSRYELTFDTPAPGDNNPWPFDPPAQKPIVVPRRGYSGWFTVRANAVHAGSGGLAIGYGYEVDPPPPDRPTPEIIPDP